MGLDNHSAHAISDNARTLPAWHRVSLPRCLSTFCAVLVLAGATTAPVSGQAEQIDLQLKLNRAETLYYHVLLSQEGSRRGRGYNLPTDGKAEGRLALRVLDVAPDSTMLVESVIENLRVTVMGFVRDGIDSPVLFKIRPDGSVIEVHRGRGSVIEVLRGTEDSIPLSDLAREFPHRPVRVGDSWGTPFSARYAGDTFDVRPMFTLVSVDRTDAGRAAHIRTRIEGTLRHANPPERQLPQHRVTGTIRQVGEVVWSVEQGRLVQRTSETTVESESSVINAEGKKIVASTHAVHATERFEALAPDKIPPARVAPGSLIAPGKSVGAFALGKRMDDLVRILGSANPSTSPPDATMSGAGRGFRARAASWPDRFIAYVDPENRSALLGLGVADPSFRTDKGLGVGSSEGAVLFAHGMSPTRLTMASGAGTPDPIQLLIYTDQGIAYAITTQETQSTAPRSRSPVGVVRWIAIFPPGGAGKIFPLP